jgi:hypothetical protein
MKVKEEDRPDCTVAAVTAPEDLRRGDFVAVLSEILELPSFLWCDVSARERGELVRIRWLPTHDRRPLKIKQICLPFVFVKTPSGTFQTIDIRLTHLARLDRSYAKAVRKALKTGQPR